MAQLKILGTRAKAEFPATLYPSGGFVCLNLPREASARLGRRSRTPVIGSLNGYPVRTSVFPSGDGGHFMLVNKEMQKGARVSVGDTVRMVLEVDSSPRIVDVPSDLRGALERSKAKEVFDKLSYSHKRRYVAWIEEAKRPDTRVRRIKETIARLLAPQGR